MPSNPRIVISGAGIAGLTLAWWLEEFGFEPVVCEKRPDLADEGYMIDFYGSGFDVAQKMGLREPLAARHYPVSRLVLADRQGRPSGAFQIDAFRKLLGYRHFNFMRGDLAAVLYESLQQRVPIRFNASLEAIHARPDGVEVELSDGSRAACDLLIGADGVHSQTRGRAERRGRQTREQQLAWLDEAFGSMGWIVPQLLEGMRQAPHLYFDAVTQIQLTPWHRDRVALVGDACQCLTLLAGQGASMAMAGAYWLACELRDAGGDYRLAFPAYQARLQPEIERRQAQARGLAKSFVPGSELGIWLTGLFLRFAFWPGLRSLFRRQVGGESIIH